MRQAGLDCFLCLETWQEKASRRTAQARVQDYVWIYGTPHGLLDWFKGYSGSALHRVIACLRSGRRNVGRRQARREWPDAAAIACR